MAADTPLLPLAAVSLGLFALVGILVFAVLKLRRAGRNDPAGADRLSEEAFAAATIQAALGSRTPPAAGRYSTATAGDGLAAQLTQQVRELPG